MSANGDDHLPMYMINILHILLQGILLVIVGYMKEKTPKYVYVILGLLAISIIYFISFPTLDLTYWNMVYLSHYLLILPSLLYISYIGYYNNISKPTFDLILWVGVFIILYHAYKAYNRLYPNKKGSDNNH